MRQWIIIAAFLPMLGGTALAQDTVKIGYIDPLSGGGASVGEVGDPMEAVEVALGIAAAAAARAGRFEEALALVDTQRLGVHTSELSGHGDHVNRSVNAFVASFWCSSFWCSSFWCSSF